MILSRMHQFVKLKKLSFNQFEKSLGVSHGSISNAIKNNRGIGSKVLQKLLYTYPELSAEWLFRGKGQMVLSDPKEKPQQQRLDIQELPAFDTNDHQQVLREVEQNVLSAWEAKYGQELKIIKKQLMILFTAQLDNEKANRRKAGSNSNTG